MSRKKPTALAVQAQRSKKRLHFKARRSPRIELLSDIDLPLLRQRGVYGIILDLDNTIVSEDDQFLCPFAQAWIDLAKQYGFKLFILTNGHRHRRIEYWSDQLQIPAIHPAKKPFPFAFRRAISAMKLQAKEVVVIGDSLHTDGLGAWLVGCSWIQVASLPHPTRYWEKLIGRYVHRRYLGDRELWRVEPPLS